MCGAAIDVPLAAIVPPPRLAETMFVPGAPISGFKSQVPPTGPREENQARRSPGSRAATVIAEGAIAGEPMAAFSNAFPPERQNTIPAATARSTAATSGSSIERGPPMLMFTTSA